MISPVLYSYIPSKIRTSVSTNEKFIADFSAYGKIKILRSDNGSEFQLNDFQTLHHKNNIKHETSAPYSPIFSSVSYTYKHLKKKLDPRCEKGIFVRYDRNSPFYLV